MRKVKSDIFYLDIVKKEVEKGKLSKKEYEEIKKMNISNKYNIGVFN